MIFRNLLIIFAGSAILSGCYRDINLEKYRQESTMVLNCIASPDTVVMASVSHTVFFTDHRMEDPIIVDADVRLTVNGKFVQVMDYDAVNKLYVSGFRPKVGDEIEIEAVSTFGNVSGKEVVPDAIPIRNVSLSCRTFDDPDLIIANPNGSVYGKSYEVTYHITFTDDASKRNYYCIRIENANGIAAETIDYSHDEVFIAQQVIIDGVTTDTGIYGNEGQTFTDDLFNGETYTLKIVEKGPLFANTESNSRPRRIILYSLSYAYYQYLTGILNGDENSASGSLVNLGFSEPSAHYSNITGGTGIVGAVQGETCLVDLKNVIKRK